MGMIYHANGIFLYEMDDLPAKEVAIVAHGAWFRKDIPNLCSLPPRTKVLFYSKHLDFSMGAAKALLNGELGTVTFPSVEEETDQIHNYRLSCDGQWMRNRHTKDFPIQVANGLRAKNRSLDLIMIEDISEDFYVHVRDVFQFLINKGKHYGTVHYTACRVQYSYKKEGWK